VLEWLRTHERDIAVDPIIFGELRFGFLILPKSKKRSLLEHWFDTGAKRLHCLSWDAQTSSYWSELIARLRKFGKAMPIKDSLIAATAITHGLAIATHNKFDFANARVDIFDPFVN